MNKNIIICLIIILIIFKYYLLSIIMLIIMIFINNKTDNKINHEDNKINNKNYFIYPNNSSLKIKSSYDNNIYNYYISGLTDNINNKNLINNKRYNNKNLIN